MNKAASALGKLAKGKPKPFTKAERRRRRARMISMNKARAKSKRFPATGRNEGGHNANTSVHVAPWYATWRI